MTNGYRSALARLLPSKMDTEKVKRDGWKEQGILVVSVADERLDWAEAEFLKRLGDKLYGKK